MTREEAIKVLKKTLAYESDFAEAKRMAIEALQEVPKRRKEAKRWKRKALQADRKERAMTDLISRTDAIEAVMAEGRKVYTSEYANAERIIYEADAVEVLSLLPSAEAVSREFYEDAVKANHGLAKENCELKARPTGEWIFNTEENGKSWNICSVCGDSIFHKTNFCPNCGAEMPLPKPYKEETK